MSETPQTHSASGCFLHLFRVMVGPTLLLVTGVALAIQRPALGSPVDFIFGGLLGLTLLATFLEPRGFDTTGGEDPPRFRRERYALALAGASLLIFVLAHFVVPSLF
jgi:hypothetical protein